MPPKHPTKPGIGVPEEEADSDVTSSGRHRTCGVGRAAIARTAQLTQRLDDHIENDDDRIGFLVKDVESISQKFETVNEHVGDLRVDVAKVAVKLDGVAATLKEQSEVRHVRVIAELNAEVETGKAQKIAQIEDVVDRKKARRAILLKVALAFVAAAGAALGMLIENCRH